MQSEGVEQWQRRCAWRHTWSLTIHNTSGLYAYHSVVEKEEHGLQQKAARNMEWKKDTQLRKVNIGHKDRLRVSVPERQWDRDEEEYDK